MKEPHNPRPRRGQVLILMVLLTFLMTLPALALFDHDDLASDGGVTPIAENLSLNTYKNVAASGTFAAVDPDGGTLTYRVTKNPARGELKQAEEGSAAFTYLPYENKTGKDSFTYVAQDADGNVSQPATVSIKISKQKTKVTYSDLKGDGTECAAVSLAEAGVFVGEQVGETWLFRPEAAVTREEFLTMSMDLVGLEAQEAMGHTGFADDDAISAWARPYVSAALGAGMIQGSVQGSRGPAFAPERVISQTEAAVMLDRLLRVTDVSAALDEEAAPAWAAQSVANLESVGVLSTGSDGTVALSEALTRAQAAQMLRSAREVLEARG